MLRRLSRLTFAVLVGFSLVLPVRAQMASVDDVLAASEARDLLGGMSAQVLATYAEAKAAQTPTDTLLGLTGMDMAVIAPRVREAVQTAFAEAVLYGYLRDAFAERAEADDEAFRAAAAWLGSDWARAFRDTVAAYQPGESLEVYAQRLRREQIPTARVRLMIDHAEARQTGALYVGVLDAVREAVRALAESDGQMRIVSDLRPLSGNERAALTQRYLGMTMLSFLHRYQPLSAPQVYRLTRAYQGDSGQWYVQAYRDALADAIRRAGQDLAARLGSAPSAAPPVVPDATEPEETGEGEDG